MGSPHGYDAGLEFDELLSLSIDRGSGGIAPGVRLTNASTNLGTQTLSNSTGVVALSNSSTSAQDLFGAGKVVTLQANTQYMFEGQFLIQTGTTSHTDALSWVASTALSYIEYYVTGEYNVLGTISTTFGSNIDVNTVNATVVTPAQTTNTLQCLFVYGTLKTGNAVTTLKPQLTFSAGPTGTCQLLQGSLVSFYPIVSQ